MHSSILFENTTRAGACSKQPGNPICTLHGTFKNICFVPTEALLCVLPGRAKNGVFHLFENGGLVAFFQEAKSVKSFVIPFKHNQGTHPQLTLAAHKRISDCRYRVGAVVLRNTYRVKMTDHVQQTSLHEHEEMDAQFLGLLPK